MLNEPTLYFITSFAAGVLWFRLLFLISPRYFNKPLTRTISRLNWHHLHWGVVFVFVAFLSMLAAGTITLIGILLTGFGFGMIIDLFIPSLLLRSNRTDELEIYKSTYVHTVILTLAIILFSIVSLWRL